MGVQATASCGLVSCGMPWKDGWVQPSSSVRPHPRCQRTSWDSHFLSSTVSERIDAVVLCAFEAAVHFYICSVPGFRNLEDAVLSGDLGLRCCTVSPVSRIPIAV